MKKLFLLCALALAAAGCDRKETPEKEQPYGRHCFYAENRLDRVVKLHFSFIAGATEALPDSMQINHYMDVVLHPGKSTMVRFFVGPPNVEPLNCLDYDDLLLEILPPRSCYIHDGDRSSEDLWYSKYWEYSRTSKWYSSYNIIIDEELMDTVF